ncbi:hypothetical protein [Bifidobacterium sp.]|jgi:hypothetical protein|uniref:hypothetical protein n=1 Tax=Bifidobacterium sp. TaxID=41200 RepID=UPI0025C0EE0B|nr:hypothetical protein [Bifidobacterium sp.]MCI1636463.1 hypothetical protein [Bifidobacterium sp.]
MTETQQHLSMRTTSKPTVDHGLSKKSALIFAHDLPGPMSMKRLCDLGILIPLEGTTAFLNSDAETLYGRASIAACVVPTGAAACTLLATWIWSGGSFPKTIDIISRSHYRAPVHGHLIRVYNRNIPPDHLRRMGKLLVTSPIRTACDLACDNDSGDSQELLLVISDLLHRQHLTPSACLALLSSNSRWPGHAKGVKMFTEMKLDFDTLGNHV